MKHKKLEIQPYLLPSENEMFQEEVNTIFKLRCRITKVKMNMKSWYDTFECSVCLDEDESQEHVYNCKEILKIRRYEGNNPQFDLIMNGNVKEQLAVARIFMENMKILEKLSNENN